MSSQGGTEENGRVYYPNDTPHIPQGGEKGIVVHITSKSSGESKTGLPNRTKQLMRSEIGDRLGFLSWLGCGPRLDSWGLQRLRRSFVPKKRAGGFSYQFSQLYIGEKKAKARKLSANI